MREIKFRAWDVKLKCMVRGDIAVGKDFCGDQTEDHTDFYVSVHDKELIPMQYTGIKDKNGVEIYEGDIVKTYSEYYGCNLIGKMEHMITGAGSTIAFVRNGGTDSWAYMNCEVIGNIYENPELLNKKGDEL